VLHVSYQCFLISGIRASFYVEAEKIYLKSLRLDPDRAIASEKSMKFSLVLN